MQPDSSIGDRAWGRSIAPDLKDLRCFVAVYEMRGFARAAIALHTVQSNISARIRRLEQTAGARLFDRSSRGTAPTRKGEQLYTHAVRILQNLGELQSAMNERAVVTTSTTDAIRQGTSGLREN